MSETIARDERRKLMRERDAALAAGDVAAFQELTARIAALPMRGVAGLTRRDIDRWNGKVNR